VYHMEEKYGHAEHGDERNNPNILAACSGGGSKVRGLEMVNDHPT